MTTNRRREFSPKIEVVEEALYLFEDMVIPINRMSAGYAIMLKTFQLLEES